MQNVTTGLLTITLATGLFAESTSLINYQGKIIYKNRTPEGRSITETKNFSIKIFDEKTEGKQIYEEAIGKIEITDSNYSFNFGEKGKSVSSSVEAIGYGDGKKTLFSYVVKNKPILSGVQISGSGYSWTDLDFSSDAAKFQAFAEKESGNVGAFYLTKAPEAGQRISISYDHYSEGISGALSQGGQAWLELTVDDETLRPRERLVTVPFALRANIARSVINKPKRILLNLANIHLKSKKSMKSGDGPTEVVFKDTKKEAIDVNGAVNIYIPDDAQRLILKFDDGLMDYVSTENSDVVIPGTPKVRAILNSKADKNEPKFIFEKVGKHEYHLEDPPHGWEQVSFSVKPLSDYGKDHDLKSLNNNLVILIE
ncbi:hypothetical protein OAM03_03055 [Verrucomicrobia bacterium]|nr:hypothetical protein [Verrucomicrobiota bacterium]